METKISQNKPRDKFPPAITGIWQNVFFHYQRYHKKDLTALRIWIVARNVLDTEGSGSVSLDRLAEACGMGKKYLKRICVCSELFNCVDSNTVRYRSTKAITRWHKLDIYRVRVRKEKVTKKFARQFKSKAGLEGYILKCYVEDDLNPKHKRRITRGRISYSMMAAHFGISEKTSWNLIKSSGAVSYRNVRDIPNNTFASLAEFESWRFHNMDKVINGHRIEENPFSYRVRRRNDGTYVLCQQLPNVYKFTGLSLASARAVRVNHRPH